tara:strand:- start:183 stop:1106 length:924 start_codon:yes stop_codon:yes gene_type:complete
MMRDFFIEELAKHATADPNIMLITGDLGFGVFDEFRRDLPAQFINAGVAEQNMTMIAAGMAIEGKKIFTYSIGNFPTLRCLEQIRNDVCYHDLDVCIVSIGGGFSYGQLGMSHHAIEDLSIMRAMPNLRVFVPGTLDDVGWAIDQIINQSGPSYLRLDKSFSEIKALDNYRSNTASIITEGDDVTLISSGGILQEALKVENKLQNAGISCRIVNMHTLKPLDTNTIIRACKETKGIVTIEENTISGGLGSAVAEVCMDNLVFPNFFKRIGIKDIFPTVVGDQNYLREEYEINSDYIVDAILKVFKNL